MDNPDDTFTATACPQASEHGYGSFTMTAGGVWTYTLDPANPAVEALRSCDMLIDCFTVTTIDGTPQVVTVTIQGAGDPHDQSFHFKEDAAPRALASAAAAPPDPVPPTAQAELPAPHPTEPGSDVWHLAGHVDGTVHGGPPLLAPHHDFIV